MKRWRRGDFCLSAAEQPRVAVPAEFSASGPSHITLSSSAGDETDWRHLEQPAPYLSVKCYLSSVISFTPALLEDEMLKLLALTLWMMSLLLFCTASCWLRTIFAQENLLNQINTCRSATWMSHKHLWVLWKHSLVCSLGFSVGFFLNLGCCVLVLLKPWEDYNWLGLVLVFFIFRGKCCHSYFLGRKKDKVHSKNQVKLRVKSKYL